QGWRNPFRRIWPRRLMRFPSTSVVRRSCALGANTRTRSSLRTGEMLATDAFHGFPAHEPSFPAKETPQDDPANSVWPRLLALDRHRTCPRLPFPGQVRSAWITKGEFVCAPAPLRVNKV